MTNKTEILFDGLGFKVTPPQGLELNIPLEHKAKIKALEDYSSELYSKYLKGLNYMQMSDALTSEEERGQYWLIDQLKKIVIRRADIDSEIKAIKIQIAKDWLELLSTYSKPKPPIKIPVKEAKQPSKRWRK